MCAAPIHSLHAVSCLGPGGFHRMAYHLWATGGTQDTCVCVHGLTRNGRDFDRLAAALAAGARRVACPDLVGRGDSGWLADAGHYALPTYLSDIATLIARLGVECVDWVGTSLGGLIGIVLAALPGTPIRRLVLNDIGPFVPRTALARIAGYVGDNPRFADVGEAETYLRHVHHGFGQLSDAEWLHLARHSVRQMAAAEGEQRTFRFHYDPKIGDAFRRGMGSDVDLWQVWRSIRIPVLVLHGQISDVLTPEVVAAMPARRTGDTRIVEIPGVGHAPTLMAASQIDLVRDFLLAP